MAYDGDYIQDLDPSLPAPVALTANEPTTEWDDAMREIKRVMQTEFPNVVGPVNLTQAQLNLLALEEAQQKLILRSGGNMQGPLVSAADPVDDLDLVNKQWVDQLFLVPPVVPPPDYPFGWLVFDELPRQPLALNTLFTTPNTEGTIPDKWIIKLYCVTAEYGYKPEDFVVFYGPQSNDTTGSLETGGLQPFANTTEVGVQTGSRIFILDKNNGILRRLTPSRWQLAMQFSTVIEDPLTFQFIRDPCNLALNFGAPEFNQWFDVSGNLIVTPNASKWDITDPVSSYSFLSQYCVVAPTSSGIELWRVEMLVDKDPAPTAFTQCRVSQYSEFSFGGTQTLIADNSSNFKLDDGDSAERLNPGGITNFVEDLGSQWRFVMQFNKLEATAVIHVRFYPAVGDSWPNETGSATGTATVQCINGYRSAYVPP